MSQHFPILIVLLPLTAALLSPFLSYFHRHAGKWASIVSLGGAFLCAVGLLLQTVQGGGQEIHYWFGNWAPPLGIEFVVDPINGAIVVMITFIALLTAIYSTPFVKNSSWLQESTRLRPMFYTIGLMKNFIEVEKQENLQLFLVAL